MKSLERRNTKSFAKCYKHNRKKKNVMLTSVPRTLVQEFKNKNFILKI